MKIEVIVIILIALAGSYVAFKVVKRVLVAFMTTIALLIALIVGVAVLLYQDINSFKNHRTGDVICILTDGQQDEILAAAVYSPHPGKSQQMETNRSAQNSQFTILKGNQLETLQNKLATEPVNSLLHDYYKVVFIKPDAIDYMIQTRVSVFDLSFEPYEIKQLVKNNNPHAFLMKKFVNDNTYQINLLVKLFSSPAELKGSIFFGSVFDQLRKDNLKSLVGFIKACHNEQLTVHKDTIVFQLVRLSPLLIAQKLMQTIQNIMSSDSYTIPTFGQEQLNPSP